MTVAGTLTAEAGRLGHPALIAIQDASAGIVVRLPDGVTAPNRGTPIVVSGVLAAPYGQLEIRPALGGIALGVAPEGPPEPLPVDSAGLGEATEGRLAVIVGTVPRTPAQVSHGDLVAVLVDDAGDEARILVDGSSGLVRADLVAGTRYRLTGIVGQRASRKGRLDGYRLWLRDRVDIVALATPTPTPTSSPAPGSTPTSTSGTTPTPSQGGVAVSPIAHALAAGPGTAIGVEGIVTAPSTLLDATGRRIIIQDRTGAIEVRIPAGAEAPETGQRVRVGGLVARAYDAPRLQAASLEVLGAAALPGSLVLTRAPGAVVEWRLVRIAGVVVDVHRLGERWRAELRTGDSRVVIVGLPGAQIPADALVEGRRATIVGIVRRPYPGAADRRFAILPRSVADVSLGAAASAGSAGSAPGSSGGPGTVTGVGTSGGPGMSGATRDDRGGGLGGEDSTAAPLDVDLDRLARHGGERVRVGGLVAALETDGFVLDDGTSTGRIVLRGEAAAFLGLIEPGDALDATGLVEADGPDGAHLVVDLPAGIVRAGDLGEPGSSPDVPTGDPIGGASDPAAGLDSAPSSTSTAARAAGLAGFPDPTAAGVGWLILASAASVAMTLLRRRHLQRRLASRVLERLAALAAPPERVP